MIVDQSSFVDTLPTQRIFFSFLKKCERKPRVENREKYVLKYEKKKMFVCCANYVSCLVFTSIDSR